MANGKLSMSLRDIQLKKHKKTKSVMSNSYESDLPFRRYQPFFGNLSFSRHIYNLQFNEANFVKNGAFYQQMLINVVLGCS